MMWRGLLLHTFIIFSESVHDTCALEKINLYQKAVYSHPDYFYCGGWRLLLHWPACCHHYLVLKAAAREITESLQHCAKPHNESSSFIRPNKFNHVPMVITAYSTTLPEYRRCRQAHWKVDQVLNSSVLMILTQQIWMTRFFCEMYGHKLTLYLKQTN